MEKDFHGQNKLFLDLATNEYNLYLGDLKKNKWRMDKYDKFKLGKVAYYFGCYCSMLTPVSEGGATCKNKLYLKLWNELLLPECKQFYQLKKQTGNLNIAIGLFIFIIKEIVKSIIIYMVVKIGFKTKT